MRWYEWVLVLTLIVSSNILTLYIAKEYLFKPKVVDLMRIGLFSQKELYERMLKGEDAKTIEAEVIRKSRELERVLRGYRGVVLIKQCVVAGHVEDITDEVAKRISIK